MPKAELSRVLCVKYEFCMHSMGGEYVVGNLSITHQWKMFIGRLLDTTCYVSTDIYSNAVFRCRGDLSIILDFAIEIACHLPLRPKFKFFKRKQQCEFLSTVLEKGNNYYPSKSIVHSWRTWAYLWDLMLWRNIIFHFSVEAASNWDICFMCVRAALFFIDPIGPRSIATRTWSRGVGVSRKYISGE